jgi:ABC-type multidrug transport system ATPase subunit
MLLDCKNLDFHYPGTDKIIFKNLSFSFSKPGLHAIFGPSGVGKTSLANIISRRTTEHGGRIETQGIDTVLYSYNLERLPGWSGVGRHIERITPVQKNETRDELVKIFELNALLDRRFSYLSMGQQNRVNLLRYLVQEFQLLIMDECLANVDERTRSRILCSIKAMFPQIIFIMISHNVVEVAKFCQDIWVLRGPEKSPQAVKIEGRNYKSDRVEDPQALQHTMLEIMNAV